MDWVLATRNPGKAKEFDFFMRGTGVHFLTLDDIGVPGDIEETGRTFQENALLKCRYAQQRCSLPVLADDSGLEVEALGGAPGIYTARYAGPKATDTENLNLLLKNLAGAENRTAKFVCCLAFSDPAAQETVFRGECVGSIAQAPRGDSGFGYDPVFVPEGYAQTFGELGNAVKEKISHRTRALALLRQSLG